MRVLQEQLIQRVGGTREISVDVRIVAATHRNLQQAVNEGRFRMDLFYRLNVFPIHLPPLRERVADIRILARHFINIANHDYKRNVLFDESVMQQLEYFNWPGNIRQLENVIKRAVLMSHNNVVDSRDMDVILSEESRVIMPQYKAQSYEAQAGQNYSSTGQQNGKSMDVSVRPYAWVREEESDRIISALRQSGGNKTRAAINLGMTPRQLRYRLVKLGIET